MPARKPARPVVTAPIRRNDPAPPPPPAPPKVARYRVLSGGVATTEGAVYRGDVITAARIGPPERVAALLAKGSIAEVADGADG